VLQVVHLQGLYRDARSTELKKYQTATSNKNRTIDVKCLIKH